MDRALSNFFSRCRSDGLSPLNSMKLAMEEFEITIADAKKAYLDSEGISPELHLDSIADELDCEDTSTAEPSRKLASSLMVAAVESPDPIGALRAVVRGLMAEGHEREIVAAELDELARRYRSLDDQPSEVNRPGFRDRPAVC